MVKAKKGKKKGSSSTSSTATSSTSISSNTNTTSNNNSSSNSNTNTTTSVTGSFTLNRDSAGNVTSIITNNSKKENLDELQWLRECELRHTATGEPYLQLEYQDDDELIILLQRFLEESKATTDIIDSIYQIWQQTVLSTLLQSSSIWKKERVTASDQRQMKDTLKTARYKINFILHHVTGSILTNTAKKWLNVRNDVLNMCYNTLQLIPRLAESCPHSPTDIRLAIIHFEGKEFLAAVACETWDTLYDYSIQINPNKFIPVLRKCAMLDILDKDWNMLGGWDDILKGIETKCCNKNSNNNNNANNIIQRLPTDIILHETTTILRNARNSMQCKFFSVRFMRYTEDQAPQRWRYFPKCSAPACSNIETQYQQHYYRCTKCYYFHYCSPACQEYCDNIMCLHPKFCKDTPQSKALLCQKETEQYLGWNTSGNNNNNNNSDDKNNNKDNNDDDVNNIQQKITCHACGALEEFTTTTTTNNTKKTTTTTSNMKRCQQCHNVSYCSKQCQEWDWRVGGHREYCQPPSDDNNKDGGVSTTTTTGAVELN